MSKKTKIDLPEILTSDESDRLVLSLGYSRSLDKNAEHGGTFSEDDAQKILDWALESRINYGLLENVLSFNLIIDIVDGEFMFKKPPKRRKTNDTQNK